MPRCAATKGDGQGCARIVSASSTYCYSHDPARAAERVENARKAGKAGAGREVRALKGEIRELIADVRAGDVDRNDATAMISGYRALRDYIELERRVAEQDELLERIEQLERFYEGAS